MALCGVLLIFDGFDTQAIGYVAPAILREWRVGCPELGPIFSSGLAGLMLGALLLGPIADRFGRKRGANGIRPRSVQYVRSQERGC
jgi:MFS transporter, AAHS family, 4-hydroxybenzoate transporter